MAMRPIGDIIRNVLGDARVRAAGVYLWTFAEYSRCPECRQSIEWWWSSTGREVAIEPDPSTFWTKGGVLRLTWGEVHSLVHDRGHWAHCAVARGERRRKRYLATREDAVLRRYERRLREEEGEEEEGGTAV